MALPKGLHFPINFIIDMKFPQQLFRLDSRYMDNGIVATGATSYGLLAFDGNEFVRTYNKH